jgi:hypothetical protein
VDPTWPGVLSRRVMRGRPPTGVPRHSAVTGARRCRRGSQRPGRRAAQSRRRTPRGRGPSVPHRPGLVRPRAARAGNRPRHRGSRPDGGRRDFQTGHRYHGPSRGQRRLGLQAGHRHYGSRPGEGRRCHRPGHYDPGPGRGQGCHGCRIGHHHRGPSPGGGCHGLRNGYHHRGPRRGEGRRGHRIDHHRGPSPGGGRRGHPIGHRHHGPSHGGGPLGYRIGHRRRGCPGTTSRDPRRSGGALRCCLSRRGGTAGLAGPRTFPRRLGGPERHGIRRRPWRPGRSTRGKNLPPSGGRGIQPDRAMTTGGRRWSRGRRHVRSLARCRGPIRKAACCSRPNSRSGYGSTSRLRRRHERGGHDNRRGRRPPRRSGCRGHRRGRWDGRSRTNGPTTSGCRSHGCIHRRCGLRRPRNRRRSGHHGHRRGRSRTTGGRQSHGSRRRCHYGRRRGRWRGRSRTNGPTTSARRSRGYRLGWRRGYRRARCLLRHPATRCRLRPLSPTSRTVA